MVIKKKKKPKRRKPKGKPLSEAIRDKEARRESDLGTEGAEGPEAAPGDGPADELKSEPPPSFEDALAEDERGPEPPAPFDDEEPARPTSRDDDDVVDASYDEDEEPPRSGASDEEEEDEYEEEEDEELAAQMGHRRYVIAGFFGLWLVVSYVLGRALETAWSKFASKDWFVEKVPQLAAIPHEGELVSRASVSLVVGALIGGIIVLRYYVKPEIRTWADEVAEELGKVKWPTRKEVGNNTVVVIAASAVITLYLTVLDRLWGFVTNLIYSTGL